MSNHRTLLQDMKRGINCRLEAIAAIESLEAEVEEQARLLGASGSREVELRGRVEALENPNNERQVFAAKMLATFTQPDVDCYLLAGIIYTAMQEPKMAAALVQEPTK